jgi:hypothetical protein
MEQRPRSAGDQVPGRTARVEPLRLRGRVAGLTRRDITWVGPARLGLRGARSHLHTDSMNSGPCRGIGPRTHFSYLTSGARLSSLRSVSFPPTSRTEPVSEDSGRPLSTTACLRRQRLREPPPVRGSQTTGPGSPEPATPRGREVSHLRSAPVTVPLGATIRWCQGRRPTRLARCTAGPLPEVRSACASVEGRRSCEGVPTDP